MGSSEMHSGKNLTHFNSSAEVLSKEMAATELLGFWGRVSVLVVGSSIVLVSIVIVTCLVRQRCWLNSILFRGGSRDKRELKTFEKEKLFGAEPPLISYKTADTFVQTTTSNGGTMPPQKENFFQSSMRRLTPPFAGPQNVGEHNSLLGSLSTKRDSTYSSMSENSGRTSPSNSCKSSVEGSMCSAGGSNIGSPTVGDAQGQISFGIQFVLTNEERGAGRLIINVGEARGLQGRQYMGGACDPYLKVIVWKERRSLRKLKTSPLHVYRTRTVRHTTEPSFNETFVTEINKSELRDLTVKIVAMDSDKWVSPTTLGEVIQPLRDIKTLATNPEKTTLNYFLAPAKMDIGEILFGLSYLPTAQRLSVSVIKAAHLKYSNIVEDINHFCPYVRALLISPSGRVLRKKKTTFRTNTDKPVWNETLIFDMPQNFVDNVTFILAVCSRPPPPTNESSSEAIINAEIEENLSLCPPPLKAHGNGASPAHEPYRKHDKYIGKVVLGCNVSGEEERKHWMAVLSAPRKVASQWHSLK